MIRTEGSRSKSPLFKYTHGSFRIRLSVNVETSSYVSFFLFAFFWGSIFMIAFFALCRRLRWWQLWRRSWRWRRGLQRRRWRLWRRRILDRSLAIQHLLFTVKSPFANLIFLSCNVFHCKLQKIYPAYYYT